MRKSRHHRWTASVFLWAALVTPADAARIAKGTISHPGSNQGGGRTEMFSVAFTATVPDVVVVVSTSVVDPCGCLSVTGSGTVGDVNCQSDGSGLWYCTVSGLTPGMGYAAEFSGFWWYGSGVYTSMDVLEDTCPVASLPKARTPDCAPLPSTLVFSPSTGAPSDQSFTITHRGPGGTLRGEVTLQGAGSAFSVVAGGGSYSLAAGESRVVSIRFTPGQTGTESCKVFTSCGTVSLIGISP